jgi:hypothetical protein
MGGYMVSVCSASKRGFTADLRVLQFHHDNQGVACMMYLFVTQVRLSYLKDLINAQ